MLSNTNNHFFLNHINKLFPFFLLTFYYNNTLTINIKPEFIKITTIFLKNHKLLQCSILTLIGAVDYPFRKNRFEIVYDFLTIKNNARVRLKTFVNHFFFIESICTIFSSSVWWEREIWDLFGIFFQNNFEIKRILTDYGFEGHPLRKDFPLTGYVESRYDEKSKRVVCEPIELTQEFRFFDFSINWFFI